VILGLLLQAILRLAIQIIIVKVFDGKVGMLDLGQLLDDFFRRTKLNEDHSGRLIGCVPVELDVEDGLPDRIGNEVVAAVEEV
jgi:hypothetical protein